MATRGRPRKNPVPTPAVKEEEQVNTTEAAPEQPAADSKVPKPKRVKRVPLGRQRHITRVLDQDPNWNYRWINDKEDRLARAKAGGYDVVTSDHIVGETTIEGGQNPKYGSAVAKQVGGGMWAVLMRIPREYYDEDQKAKQDEILSTERQMVREEKGKDQRYGDFGFLKDPRHLS